MFVGQFMKRTCFLLAVVSCLLPTATGFSASAPMPVTQLALYQGGDREKLLVEGAKREGQFTLIYVAYMVSHSREGFREKVSFYQSI